MADRIEGRSLRAHARVRLGNDAQWWVTVELDGEGIEGSRSLRAPSCEEAMTATAVVVAIALDPQRQTTDELATEAPALQEPTIPPAPEPVIPPAPEPASTTDDGRGTSTSGSAAEGARGGTVSGSADAEPSSPLRALLLEARGGLDVGALPGPSGTLAAAVGLRGDRWWLTAGATHRFRTERTIDDAGFGGAFRSTAGQLLAGPWLSWGRLELPLRAGVEVGTVWARGEGPVTPIEVRRLWAAAIASVGVGWSPAKVLGLRLGIDGVVPLARPAFTLGDTVEVHTVGAVALRAWLGLELRFVFEDRRRAGK